MATDDESEAHELAAALDGENKERRTIERSAANSILSRMNADPTAESHGGIVLYDPDWHPGVIGIIAARCVERHYKPTIVLTQWDGVLKGSGRSTDEVDLFSVLAPHSGSFVAFGGHAKAVGLTLAIDRLAWFRETFGKAIGALGNEKPLPSVAPLRIDGVVEIQELTLDFVRTLARIEPFGAANPRPRLVLKNAHIAAIHAIGKNPEDGHCRIELESSSSKGLNTLRLTAFGLRPHLEALSNREQSLHVVVEASENHWRGKTRLELRLIDFGPADPT
jgi:single-stranded-DNA-specific exonuclease